MNNTDPFCNVMRLAYLSLGFKFWTQFETVFVCAFWLFSVKVSAFLDLADFMLDCCLVLY